MKKLSILFKRASIGLVLMTGGQAVLAQTQTTYSPSSLISPLDNAGTSARATAMGSAFVAVADDSSALFWNPAGLGTLKQADVTAHANSWLVDTARGSLALGLPLGEFGGIGVAGTYMDYGTFDGHDITGALTGSYSANQMGLDLGWGRRLAPNFVVGLGVQGSQQTLPNQSYEEFGLDLGILFIANPHLKVGADYHNLGGARGTGVLTSSLRVGVSYLADQWDLNQKILLAASGLVEPSGLNRFQVGAEDLLYSFFALRVGYQDILFDNQIDGTQGLSAGVGVRWNDLQLDYAFLPFGDLGASQQLSLGYSFDMAPEEKKAPLAAAPAPVTVYVPAPNNVVNQAQPQPVGPPTGDDLTVEFKMPPEAVAEGKKLEQEGKTQEAIAVYTQALEKNNEDVLAWYGLGLVYFRTGQKDYAVQCFEQVLRLKPNPKLADWLGIYKASPPTAAPQK